MDNTNLFFFIFNLSHQYAFLDALMIFGARYLILLTFFIVFILSFKGSIKEKKAFLLIILSLPLAVLIIMGIHLFIYEPRPFITLHLTPLYPYIPDASFPSRHAAFMAVATFVYLYFKSKWSMLFLIFMLWVGISRIYVGIHYPIDILGGILVGILSLIIARLLVKFLKLKFSWN